jgi:hypothetical protein
MRELIFIFTTILHQDGDTTHYHLISRMKLMKMMIDAGPKNGVVRVSALASLVDRGSLLSAMPSSWLN